MGYQFVITRKSVTNKTLFVNSADLDGDKEDWLIDVWREKRGWKIDKNHFDSLERCSSVTEQIDETTDYDIRLAKPSGFWTLYLTNMSYENPEMHKKPVLLVKEAGRGYHSNDQNLENERLSCLVKKLLQLGVDKGFLDKSVSNYFAEGTTRLLLRSSDGSSNSAYDSVDADSENIWIRADRSLEAPYPLDYDWEWSRLSPSVDPEVVWATETVLY